MSLFSLLLLIHVIGGSLSLLLGTYLLIRKKGDKTHRFIGNIYFVSMLSSAIVALPMSYLHINYFLFIIAVFTIYMLFTGRRYIKKHTKSSIHFMDWLASAIMLVFAILFIIYGVFYFINKQSFGIILFVFGGISLLFVYQDYINFSGKSKTQNFGLTTHLQRMIGSYIASLTAFLVVNNTILPPVLAWLLPTIVVVPFIVKWSRKHQLVSK